MKKKKLETAPPPDASEAPVLATHLSSDHLLQMEKASYEVRLAEAGVAFGQKDLEARRIYAKLAQLTATEGEELLIKARSNLEKTKQLRTDLVKALKDEYKTPETFAYCPDTGSISRD